MEEKEPKESKDYATIIYFLTDHKDTLIKWRYIYDIGKQHSFDYEYDFFSMNCFINAAQGYMSPIVMEMIHRAKSQK